MGFTSPVILWSRSVFARSGAVEEEREIAPFLRGVMKGVESYPGSRRIVSPGLGVRVTAFGASAASSGQWQRRRKTEAFRGYARGAHGQMRVSQGSRRLRAFLASTRLSPGVERHCFPAAAAVSKPAHHYDVASWAGSVRTWRLWAVREPRNEHRHRRPTFPS